MNDNVYKSIELTGSSPVGLQEAVNNAVRKAGQTVKKMRWFEVTDIRGDIDDDAVQHWQVTLKISFIVE
jgi:dodecin